MRAYTVTVDEDEGTVLGIVSDTAKEARIIAFNTGDIDRPWIEVKAEWHKNVDVSGLEKGIVPLIEGVKRGIYGWAETQCPKCGNNSRIFLQKDGSVTCMKCLEDSAIIEQQVF